MDFFSILRNNGPDGLVGERFDINGQTYELESINSIGDQSIVYNAKNLQSLKSDIVVKIPKSQPGSEEYNRYVNSTRLALERIPDLIAPTQIVNVAGNLIIVQERVKPFTAVIEEVLKSNKETKNTKQEKKSNRKKIKFTSILKANFYTKKGIKALAKNEPLLAISFFDKALGINPYDICALNNKGVALYDQSKYDEALEYFQNALDQRNDDVDTLINKGNVLVKKEDLKGAFLCFQRVINIDENNVNGLIAFGRVLGMMGEYLGARVYFEKANLLEPSNQEAIFFLNETQKIINKQNN